MQPIILTIPGEYWDSQIYAGRLYLFQANGSIRTLDWDRTIERWNIGEDQRLALECAFLRGQYLYGKHWERVFGDREVSKVIWDKFKRLASEDLEISRQRLSNVTIKVQDNRLPFPHADSAVYEKKLYVISREGLYTANVNKQNVNPVSTRHNQLWDCPGYSMSISYSTIALSTGIEGLFELSLSSTHSDRVNRDSDPFRNVYERHSSQCNWNYHSIFSSSSLGSGCLIEYENKFNESDDQRSRDFIGYHYDENLFNTPGYSWGLKDKIYHIHNGTIDVLKYSPYREDPSERIELLDHVTISSWKGEVISAGASFFGTIIECEQAIIIIPSKGAPITIRGEPVRWRVFPRSTDYTNQLHIIYDDHMKIYSFNHDYLVDQTDKTIGSFYSTKFNR